MEFVDGDIFDDPFVKEKSESDKNNIYKSLAESLGRLHSFNIDDLNLPFKKNHGFMKRNLSLWYDQIFNETNKPDKDIERVFQINHIGPTRPWRLITSAWRL